MSLRGTSKYDKETLSQTTGIPQQIKATYVDQPHKSDNLSVYTSNGKALISASSLYDPFITHLAPIFS